LDNAEISMQAIHVYIGLLAAPMPMRQLVTFSSQTALLY